MSCQLFLATLTIFVSSTYSWSFFYDQSFQKDDVWLLRPRRETNPNKEEEIPHEEMGTAPPIETGKHLMRLLYDSMNIYLLSHFHPTLKIPILK